MFCSRDIVDLLFGSTLGILRWVTELTKMTRQIFSLHGCMTASKKITYGINSFLRNCSLKNPAIWWEHLGLWSKKENFANFVVYPRKPTTTWSFWQKFWKMKKIHFGDIFSPYSTIKVQWIFLKTIRAPSGFRPYNFLTK